MGGCEKFPTQRRIENRESRAFAKMAYGFGRELDSLEIDPERVLSFELDL